MLTDMWKDGWLGRSLLAVMALLILTLPLLVWAGIVEEKQWQAFKVSHACKIVGHVSGSSTTTVAPIIGGNGGVAVGVSSTPDKTGWACDDGVTYWR